jgi:hypothetical protein
VDEVRATRVEEPRELVLEDLAEGEGPSRARAHYFGEVDVQDSDAPVPRSASAPARSAPDEAARERGVPLTKFRDGQGSEPASATDEPRADARPRGARLARVRLVKRARTGASPAAGSVLLRLLGCF